MILTTVAAFAVGLLVGTIATVHALNNKDDDDFFLP